MNYVVYNTSMKVEQIVAIKPESIEEGLFIAQSEDLQLGDEFSYSITIHEVTEDIVKSYSAYRVAPKVEELLKDNYEKEKEIKDLKKQLSLAQQALDDLILGGM
ncbi:hypothetical protein [Abyssisolibacter fermentans]|uniref:hypothetical protein n=1 Tax=Abyssisolibacter fermentans TaxID=1766203 RepID=UPI00083077E9|nr:hypothetical protein [Abyssisolibacter fermentans]